MDVIVTQCTDDDLLARATAVHDGLLGDPSTLGPLAEDLSAAARLAGHSEALVVALRAVAWWRRLQLRNDLALLLLDQAADEARRSGLPHRLGEVLVSRAAVKLELGRTTAARHDLDRAAHLVGDSGAPDLQLKRGVLLSNVGQLDAAVRAYRRVLAHPLSTVDLRCRAATNLALDQASAGRAGEALRHIDLAVDLAGQVGAALAALVSQNRALVLTQCGRLAEGLRQLDDAVEALAAVGLPLGEAHLESAETLCGLRALPEARDAARRAVHELERSQAPLMAAEARLTLAQIALLMGDHVAALQDAALATQQLRAQRRTSWAALAAVVVTEAHRRAGTLTGTDIDRACRAADALARCGLVSGAVSADLALGRAAQDLGRTGIARRRLAEAYRQSRRGPVLVRLQGRLAAALAAEAEGNGPDVVRHCRAGLTDLAAHRSALGSMELRALAAAHGVELGQLGLGCLLRSGSPARVLEWTERIRAAALLAVAPPAPDALREERAELAAVQAELARARRETGLEPDALLSEQSVAEARVRRAAWHRTATGTTSTGTRSTCEIRGVLDDRTLVSYVCHGSDLLAVVVDGRRTRMLQLGRVDVVQREVAALLFALRRIGQWPGRSSVPRARDSAEQSLVHLRRLLIEPLAIDQRSPLVVVPTGSTHLVPWSALHDGPVGVAPSACSWAATRSTERDAARVVVVAGPDLSAAEEEVDAVAARHPQATVLCREAATAEAVLEAMSGAGLVHLACHGALRADNPMFSSFRLADGALTLHELDLRGVAPRRVVLAACDSAAGTAYPGDEVLGFVGALLARGTAGVVASVVSVVDAEAVGLMDRLHVGLAAGLTVADALHEARAAVDRADPRQFVNWCGFTAFGGG